MKTLLRLGLGCLLAGGLAACSDKQAGQTESGGSAAGEILPGSVSDEMLPYDTIRSQAPPANMPGKDDGDTPGEGRTPAQGDSGADAASAGPAEAAATETGQPATPDEE